MVLPSMLYVKGLVPISMAFGTGGFVLVRQMVGQNTEAFGEFGGWIIGVLILAIGALIAFGIRDFQSSQRQMAEKLDKLEGDVFSLRGDFREHVGRSNAVGELATRLQASLLAEKKTTRRTGTDRFGGGGT